MSARPFPRRGVPTEADLRAGYNAVRQRTLELTATLSAEDMAVQAMADTSPAKWHLAHTTWFFETFVLRPYLPGYRVCDERHAFLFNSYYDALGPRQPRPQRGLLTRPSLADVLAYREHVDRHMQLVFDCGAYPGLDSIVRLGIAHEEQHQELLLMDILYLFAQSPLRPAYDPDWPAARGGDTAQFRPHDGGLVEIGHDAAGFAFDNERPRHRVWLEPFEIADHLITNGEWLAFIAAGGYTRAALWLADGWAQVQANAWQAPLHWRHDGAEWHEFTLRGQQPLDPRAPVGHVSYYEADAFARWAGARLPTEAEWEAAAVAGHLQQQDDARWQWTQSAYAAYPGFRPARGAIGEYNGKFMVNQFVLRGGASITPVGHSRPTYRNFYGPEKRWQFAGVRLARDRARPRRRQQAGLEFADAEFADHVRAGLALAQKSLSPKYFYDAEGSRLFEAICRTREYYLTRVETALLQRVAPLLAQSIAADAALLEFGSGASEKTRLLLDAADSLAQYLPIDISGEALSAAARRIARAYPRLEVIPLTADFTGEFGLPHRIASRPRVGFFPGSTIGNFSPADQRQFFRRCTALLGSQGRLVVGADLVKERRVLEAAYNDSDGVTARFNKNLLVRINRELGGTFDLDSFDHLALWNEAMQRIEMHLVSRVDQIVLAAGEGFAFKAGERLHTENSHKFTLDGLAALAAETGWCIARHWIDVACPFAILELWSAPPDATA